MSRRRRTPLVAMSVAGLLLAVSCGNQTPGAARPAVGSSAGSTPAPTPAPSSSSSSVPAVSYSKSPSPTSTVLETPTSPAPSVAPTSASPSPTASDQWSPHGTVTAATSWPREKCKLPTTLKHVIPHFDTPQAAMTFLTQAYNCNDVEALKRVTVDAARQALLGMTSEATNLKLDKCVANKRRHDYDCTFTHDLPTAAKADDSNGDGRGEALFAVAPALRSGWYMTVLIDCGG